MTAVSCPISINSSQTSFDWSGTRHSLTNQPQLPMENNEEEEDAMLSDMCTDSFLVPLVSPIIKLESPQPFGMMDDNCVGMNNSFNPNHPSNRVIKTEQMCVGNNESTTNSEAAQVDIYRDLILRHLIQDIMCLQFQLPKPQVLTQLQGGGPALLAMSAEEFCARVPDGGGDTLHAQLQLWKTAFESYSGSKGTMTMGQQQQQSNSFGNAINHSHNSVQLLQQHPRTTSAACTGWITPPSPITRFSGMSDDGFQTAQRFLSNSSSAPSFSSYCTDLANFGNSYGCLDRQNLMETSNSTRNSSTCSSMASQFLSSQLQILPSPSESEMSSNSSCVSVQDLTDDDMHFCNDAQLFSPNAQQSMFGPNTNGNYVVMPQLHALTPSAASQQQMCGGTLAQSVAASSQQLANNGHLVAGNNNTSIVKLPNKPMGGGYPRSGSSGNSGTVHLWHFIRELLDQPKQYSSCVRWVDRQEGLFKIESSHHLARFWGLRKNRSQMNYDKLSRSLRQYYKKGIIQKPEKKQRLVYKFLPPYNL